MGGRGQAWRGGRCPLYKKNVFTARHSQLQQATAMAYFKALILFAAVFAVAYAAEEAPRTKKDVFVASPYAAVPVSYAFDDGSYYPGKYERTAYVSAAIPAVPAAYSAYSAYPYAYSAYPFRTVVAV